MKILILGAGGREHALAYKISQSPLVTALYCAPGNPGMAEYAQCIALNLSCHDEIVHFCQKAQIDFVVVGPEGPLVAGLVDILEEKNILAFGPRKKAALLEGSKGFSKDFLKRHNIKTAAYQRFTDCAAAKQYVQEKGAPIVVKADGLASGKGVVVAQTTQEALQAVQSCFSGAFGASGSEIVIEEFLQGEELSFFCLCDGERALAFGAAQDHKRVGENDTGANTGGMGAYAPPYFFTKELETTIMEEIALPTLKGMAKEGAPFRGILFLGLMLTKEGVFVIEYNVRFGDPECQILMMLLEGDVLPFFIAAAQGKLENMQPEWKKQSAITIVFAAKGYPEKPQTGTVIHNLAALQGMPHLQIFHGQTKYQDGHLVANGGRVLYITAAGDDIEHARSAAYEAIKKIDWPEGFYRSDIAARALANYKK